MSNFSEAREVIPWQEIQRMIDENETFSLPLARLLWEATWDDNSPAASTRKPPFPSTDYQTGVMTMPDGTVVSSDAANLYTASLMTALRTTLHKGPNNKNIPTKEELRERKAAAAAAEKEKRLADEQAGKQPFRPRRQPPAFVQRQILHRKAKREARGLTDQLTSKMYSDC